MAHDLNNDPVVVEPRRATTESRGWRIAFTLLALAYLAFFLILPLVAVFVEAFRKGGGEFFIAISDPETMAAIKLTLLVSAIAVPLNLVFGVAASWAIAKYEFRGKAFLTTLIDLPFSVSPVISGLVFVLLFGAGGLVRAIPQEPWHPDHFRRAGHRARHDFCDLPVRCSRTHPTDAGAGDK